MERSQEPADEQGGCCWRPRLRQHGERGNHSRKQDSPWGEEERGSGFCTPGEQRKSLLLSKVQMDLRNAESEMRGCSNQAWAGPRPEMMPSDRDKGCPGSPSVVLPDCSAPLPTHMECTAWQHALLVTFSFYHKSCLSGHLAHALGFPKCQP